ncbi:gibberellin-regulated protein 9-like [Salvia splendens]|uniref:gibberellin-regulated protein 9-like n=1 Tax=Salvia splendens TaxID=180675 RepID=UPI001C277E03|nr:gibberellin-regulated protein 9-like [Salvia splendens]XP_042007895.1 gibberellin-regulated protein 9-like [Salvia splendens]
MKLLHLFLIFILFFQDFVVEGEEGNLQELTKKHHRPRAINCNYACARRCSKSSRKKVCHRACKSCCTTCHCVPPGTYGNKALCPCYAKLKTHGNKPKCP